MALAILAGCGGDGRGGSKDAGQAPKVGDPGPIHVHGLGINPKDGALFIATHTGLFRLGEGERTAKRVADRFQDTMGFTVIGPDHFLGSGHPDGREELPPFLGLIESGDAGRTWRPVSLQGERDFHVLEADDRRVYGFGADFDSREEGLLVSDDGGRSWKERPAPEPLIALAMRPTEPNHVVAAGQRSLYESGDAGRSWRQVPGEVGLLAWPSPDRLYSVGATGAVNVSRDGARGWQRVGDAGGQAASFLGHSANELYVALHDGTIKHSPDGGASWAVRSRP